MSEMLDDVCRQRRSPSREIGTFSAMATPQYWINVLHRLLRARYPRFAVWEAHIGRGILIIVVGGFVIGLIVNNHWLSR